MKMKLVILLLGVTQLCTVAAQDVSMSIGEKFHYETGFDESGAVSNDLKFGDSLPLYKTYPNDAKVTLPIVEYDGLSVEMAIQMRESVRAFKDSSISLTDLSLLLQAAYGITRHSPDELNSRRSVPSGGALYPMEIYVIIDSVDGLGAGLYHYQAMDHSLEIIQEGYFSEEIHAAANNQACVGQTPLAIILTARFARSTHKYADRGYRYTYIEAGAVCQNIYLQATSLGLGTVAVGAFDDAAVNELLQVDGTSEAALLIMPVGRPR